jgi:hypothetical protein
MTRDCHETLPDLVAEDRRDVEIGLLAQHPAREARDSIWREPSDHQP